MMGGMVQLELSIQEAQALEQHEAVIEQGLRTFVDVGNALLRIRDGRLYRGEYGTWDEYLRGRWEIERTYAHRMIDAASVVGNLLPIGNIVPQNEAQARPLTCLEPEQQREVWTQVIEEASRTNGKITGGKVQEAVDRIRPQKHQNVSDRPDYDGDEWHTPLEYIEAAREVMGDIDLDPASNETAQADIQAARWFTKQDDGLTHPWAGRVWLNPPYSMPKIEQFADKLIGEFDRGNVQEAIILVNNSSDTRWFHSLLDRFPACFTRGRVQFWHPNYETFAARQGQVFFYLGRNAKGFQSVFDRFGIVVRRL